MAFYIKKDKKSSKEQKENKNVSPTMRPFFQILGCVIVLIIVLIIWAVKG